MVADLPENMGKENHGGKRPAQPQPFVQELPSLGRQDEAHHQPRAKEPHGVFVFQPHARHQSKQHPQPGVGAVQDQRQQIYTQCPNRWSKQFIE